MGGGSIRWAILVLALVVAVLVLPPIWYVAFAEPPPELPAPGRRVEVRPGLSVNVIEEGSGPPVILVHGHPACAYDWQPLMGELAARGFRAIAYDRLGYGYSDGRPPGRVSVEMNAAELVTLIASLDLEDATLVGWSYGGGTSIIAMKQDSSRVARLLLLASIGPGIAERETVPKAPPWLAELLAGPVYDWISAVPPLSRMLSDALMGAAFHPDPVPHWYRAQTAANFGRPHTRTAFRSEGRDLGGEADLDPGPIDRPVLILHGTEDRLAPPFVAKAIHERVKGSELRWIADGSHMLPITHAADVADSIREFTASR